jgi:hypothetical protein
MFLHQIFFWRRMLDLLGERACCTREIHGAAACPNLHAKSPYNTVPDSDDPISPNFSPSGCVIIFATPQSHHGRHHIWSTCLQLSRSQVCSGNLLRPHGSKHARRRNLAILRYTPYVPNNQPLQDCSRRLSMTARGSNGLYIKYLRHQVRLRG